MSAPDDTRDWLNRAEGAAQALRGLRQRLLALHAELTNIREAMGVESVGLVSVAPMASRASDAPEASPFVWPPGRTPN